MPKLMINKLEKIIKQDNINILRQISDDLYGKDEIERKEEFINRYLKYNYYTLEDVNKPMDIMYKYNRIFNKNNL